MCLQQCVSALVIVRVLTCESLSLFSSFLFSLCMRVCTRVHTESTLVFAHTAGHHIHTNQMQDHR